jgi:hypothetical protein
MSRSQNTIFAFMQEEIETYQIKRALHYVKHSVKRVLNAIKCIKKLKEGKTKMYLVRGLMEAKLLIEFCIKNKILNELAIYNQFNQRIKYSKYSEETDYDNNGKLVHHPREYRAYIKVWKGFTEKIDRSKSINEQRVVHFKQWL